MVAIQNLKPTSIQTPALLMPAQTQLDSSIVPAQRVNGDISKDLVPVTLVDQGC